MGDSATTDTINRELRLHVFDTTNNQRFLVDTGSVVSVIPRTSIKQNLQETAYKLYAANSTIINTYGQRRSYSTWVCDDKLTGNS